MTLTLVKPEVMQRITYQHDKKGNICLPMGAPFDEKPVLMKTRYGIVEGVWCPGEIIRGPEEDDYEGFCWHTTHGDDDMDLDEASHSCPVPATVDGDAPFDGPAVDDIEDEGLPDHFTFE